MNDRIREDLEAIAQDPLKRDILTVMLHTLLLWQRIKNWLRGGGAL